MKKVCSLAVILAMTVLCACVQSIPESAEQTASAAQPAAFMQTGDEIRIICTSDGAGQQVSGKNRIYELQYFESDSFNILYKDYTTNQQVYLYTQPNNDESCTSFLQIESIEPDGSKRIWRVKVNPNTTTDNRNG